MTGLGMLGVGVASLFSTTVVAGSLSAIAIGTISAAVVGAAIGGLTAAVTGGDIGQGMLFGAVGGVAIGAAFGTSIGGLLMGGGEAGAAGLAGGTAYTGGVVETGSMSVLTSTNAPSFVAAGEIGTGAAAASESWGLGLATVGASGVKGYMEAESAKDATAAAAKEAAENRAWQTEEGWLAREHASSMAARASASAKEIAEIQDNFHLSERMTLAQQQYDAAAGLSAAESGRRINEYKAKVSTDKGVLDARRGEMRESVLSTGSAQMAQDYVPGAPVGGTTEEQNFLVNPEEEVANA